MAQQSEASQLNPTAPQLTLALIYQELLTVIVRIRANRQATHDAESFRANMRAALKSAEQTSLARGYNPQDTRLASFAVVALLDETVLNSRNPVFADWARKPLQEELFGGHVAGEIFFQSLDRLLGGKDSNDLADLLEVYDLCLLLGYRGRYGVSGPEALRGYKDAIAEKIRRIRGPLQPFQRLGRMQFRPLPRAIATHGFAAWGMPRLPARSWRWHCLQASKHRSALVCRKSRRQRLQGVVKGD